MPEGRLKTSIPVLLSVALLTFGCRDTPSSGVKPSEGNDLVGAWRARIHFTSGAFATIGDLEFMYVFNEGGTMTESSNYDAAPPVPPAYGVWRRIGPNQFEAKYTFYVTKPPAGFEDIGKGGGWLPAGYGIFVENITLAEDGKSFKSRMRYDAFDPSGKPVEGGGDADVEGTSMGF